MLFFCLGSSRQKKKEEAAGTGECQVILFCRKGREREKENEAMKEMVSSSLALSLYFSFALPNSLSLSLPVMQDSLYSDRGLRL